MFIIILSLIPGRSIASDNSPLWSQFKKIKLLNEQKDQSIGDSSDLIFFMIREHGPITLDQVVSISITLENWENNLQYLMDGSPTKTIYDYLVENNGHQPDRVKQRILETFKGNSLSTEDIIFDLIGSIRMFRMGLRKFIPIEANANSTINEILQLLKTYKNLRTDVILFGVQNAMLKNKRNIARRQGIHIDESGELDLNDLDVSDADVWFLSVLKLKLYLMEVEGKQLVDYTNEVKGDNLMTKLLEVIDLTSGVEIGYIKKINYDARTELIRMMMIDN
jgi:hypothetical protein